MLVANSDLSYLIPQLRLQVGDTDPSKYRWTDDWLNVALISAFNNLQNWWNSKYEISTVYSGNVIVDYTVSRRPGHSGFDTLELPVIEAKDERAIILMASIILLEGYLEANAWNIGSWKDFEISVSNIEGGRALREKLRTLIEELHSLYRPPSRRLSGQVRKSLPGYIGNIYEYGDPSKWND